MEKWLNRPGSYNCVYALPAGTLSRDLIACLGHSNSKGAGRRWQIPDMPGIHLRPPEIKERQTVTRPLGGRPDQ